MTRSTSAAQPGQAASSVARAGTSPSPTRIACRARPESGSGIGTPPSGGGTEALHWTPFAGMTRIRFRGSAVDRTLSAARRSPVPIFDCAGLLPARRIYTRAPRFARPSPIRSAQKARDPVGHGTHDLARAGVAQLDVRREVAPNPDAACAGRHCHPHVVERIADVGSLRGTVGKAQHVQRVAEAAGTRLLLELSLIHISEPTRLGMISYAVFC